MKAWWAGLSSREQGLVAVAAALGALLLMTQLVLRPLVTWRDAAALKVEQAETDYRLVAQAASAAVPEKSASGDVMPARNALIETARRMTVNLNFVNEHTDGSIEFQAGPVEPERAFELFSVLQRDFAIRVIAADIARSPEEPQRVRLQATVSR